MWSGWITSAQVIATPKEGWQAIAAGDFDGGERADIVLQNSISGTVTVGLMNGYTIRKGQVVATPPASWIVKGRGDFDGDGISNIVMQDSASKWVIVLLTKDGLASATSTPIVPAIVDDLIVYR